MPEIAQKNAENKRKWIACEWILIEFFHKAAKINPFILSHYKNMHFLLENAWLYYTKIV